MVLGPGPNRSVRDQSVLVRGFLDKGWFYLEFFPKEHFGALYLISNIPAGVANFVVDPIYDGKG